MRSVNSNLPASAVITLALYYARKEVRADLKRRKSHVALRELSARELSLLARDWLTQHPELLDRARALCAKLESDAQRAKARKPGTSVVRNS